MIELSHIKIEHYNTVIETRNKVYRLALDLNMSVNAATQLAILVSEILSALLAQQPSTQVKLAFTKKLSFYYWHVFMSCTEIIYQKVKKAPLFCDIHFTSLPDQKTYLELVLKIMNPNFFPNEEFLQMERERLIQQSNNEMLHEIRRKNIELNKALQDLKASSSMIQAEKMRALGGMTAGVAHELNNPMMGILNFIQYAIKHTDKEDRRYQPLVDAVQNTHHGIV